MEMDQKILLEIPRDMIAQAIDNRLNNSLELVLNTRGLGGLTLAKIRLDDALLERLLAATIP